MSDDLFSRFGRWYIDDHMGYRVPKVNYGMGWKLTFETRKGACRSEHSIPKGEWSRLGFMPSMTRDEAIARVKVLNSQMELKQIEEKRRTISERLHEEKLRQVVFLSDSEKFEAQLKGKTISHWRACRRMISELGLEPQEWADNAKLFYDYFANQKWSISYVQKIVYLLNLWGKQICRKRQHFFEPLPMPAYSQREKIDNSYFEKYENGLTSEPLKPNQLERQKDNLNIEQYNWLFLSVWFGLRPIEIDNLRKPSGKTTWWVEEAPKGKILWVYQTKLTRVPREKRAKPIPCVRNEQLIGLTIIDSGTFRRPLTKTVRARFGERVTLYAGRKGFTDLMLSFGYRLENISVWLGHRSIERTWRSYMDKQRVEFPE